MRTPLDDGQPNPRPEGPAFRSRRQLFSPSMGWRAFWSEIVIVVSASSNQLLITLLQLEKALAVTATLTPGGARAEGKQP